MREPSPGDLVLHLYHDTWPDGRTESRLAGRSLVVSPVREVPEEPPSPGTWAGMAPYYRIDLTDYRAFTHPVSEATLKHRYGDEIRREIVEDRPRHYPFQTYGVREPIRIQQGLYMGRCTARLYAVLRQALALEEPMLTDVSAPAERHEEYAEGVRAARERYFFSRNASLTTRAKEHYGPTCRGCGFVFEAGYGELGRGYIECHHLDPLSERSEEEWTEGIRSRLEDVAVLCSNCHRMIHRRRPALSLEELRHAVREAVGQQAVS
jgi:5-methylcytosine-specific restriction endonuclease McrA